MGRVCRIGLETIFHGRRRNECWFEPSAALIPPGRYGPGPAVVVFVSQLTGNDVGPHHYTWTRDGGRTWSNPAESQALQVNPLDDHVFEKPWTAPFFHRASETLLLIGSTCFTRDTLPLPGIKGEAHVVWPPAVSARPFPDLIYAPWFPGEPDCRPWKRVSWRDAFAGTGTAALFSPDPCQKIEDDDGAILCPATLKKTADERGHSVVLRLEWDGETLALTERGTILSCEEGRGFHEPSLVRFGGRYLLTLRNDRRGYVAASADGLHFDEPVPWRFDDGTDLGSYNTQQHWLARGDALYLVYTRRSELANGVFRHRAPLFMARVDPERLRVLRESERVIIPENGARMGNFCTVAVAADEAWVITGEWLEQLVPEYAPGMPFYADCARGESPFNRIQYVGDLLLARIRFSGSAEGVDGG